MESTIGLVIQFTGIVLITALSLFLRRSLKTPASTLWLCAWISLSTALCCLSFAFNLQLPWIFGTYFFFEYVFGVFLFFGCKSLSDGFSWNRRHLISLIPSAILATVLSVGLIDFNFVFNIHAFVMAAIFGAAYVALKTSHIKTYGWRVMRVALALLALDFFHYAVVFTLLIVFPGILPKENYLSYAPIFDLVLETLLGFGMVIVLLEQVLQQVGSVNEQLQAAHERLRRLAHIDPLTEAFNRHAFYGYLESGNASEVYGCVGFFDIDDLKPINDGLGHEVGDQAIRQVARSLRDLIRSDDLIYRWGGDEFFVLMIGMDEAAARQRLAGLDKMLTDIVLEKAERPITIRVSYGFRSFAGIDELESAVSAADEEMYRRKVARKERRRNAPAYASNENIILSPGR